MSPKKRIHSLGMIERRTAVQTPRYEAHQTERGDTSRGTLFGKCHTDSQEVPRFS